MKIKEVKIIKEKPYSILIKPSYNTADTYQEILIRKDNGRKPSIEALLTKNLEILWAEGKPVADAKIKDIKSYMNVNPEVD
nr:unnamed protein product [Callosobruchus analis]